MIVLFLYTSIGAFPLLLPPPVGNLTRSLERRARRILFRSLRWGRPRGQSDRKLELPPKPSIMLVRHDRIGDVFSVRLDIVSRLLRRALVARGKRADAEGNRQNGGGLHYFPLSYSFGVRAEARNEAAIRMPLRSVPHSGASAPGLDALRLGP